MSPKSFGKPLVSKDTKMNNPVLVALHTDTDHEIYIIPKDSTIVDILCYIFDNDAEKVADVLQGYEEGLDFAETVINTIREGINNHNMCLTCIRTGVRRMYKQK